MDLETLALKRVHTTIKLGYREESVAILMGDQMNIGMKDSVVFKKGIDYNCL